MKRDVAALAVAALFVFFTSACSDASKTTGDQEASEAHEEHQETNVVTLSAEAYQSAGIRTEPVMTIEIGSGTGLRLPGQVELDPRRVALISPRTSGRIERLAVTAGDRVGAGQTVALLFSSAFVAAQADYQQASRRARTLTGSADSQGAEALLEAAARRLRSLGASDADIERLASGAAPSDFLPLRAPFAGSIMEAMLLPGAGVEAGTAVFKLADLSVVDVVAAVPEPAIPQVRIGQAASIRLAAYPTEVFQGHVERLHDELDPETRTVHAVIHVPNTSRTLRAGMFASVELASTGKPGSDGATLSIPEAAVVTDGNDRFVFVETAPRTFERRPVQVVSLAPVGSAAPTSQRVAVIAGLRSGERVAVEGAFTLKSELAKSGFSDEH